MPDAPDMKALAERYLDLWEQQFSSAAADPALASAMAAWLAPWRAMAGGAMPGGAMPGAGAPGAPGNRGSKSDGPGTATSSQAGARAPQAGAAAAGVASGDGGRGLDRILERLERIERRLEALERKREPKPAGGRGRRPSGAG